MSRPAFPPVNVSPAAQKVNPAEDAWNSRDAAQVALAYTFGSRWRDRAHYEWRDAIAAFLLRKWSREVEYRRIKEFGLHTNPNRSAVSYEHSDDGGQRFRAYGNKN
jgi:nuclear transport factor 2 (NTF2) superfamily protein